MAVRTATNLKVDAAAADTALATAITTPSEANINSAITAFELVVTNGRDSENANSALRVDRGSIAKDLMVQAGNAANELRLVLRRAVDAQGNMDTKAAGKMLRRLQGHLAGPHWRSVAGLPTTS